MRTVLSFVSGALALLALLVAVPMLWLSTHVVDEDGYAQFSSTLANDAGLQRAFADYLTAELAARGVLPAPLEAVAATALAQAAGRTSNQSGFAEAWEQTQRNFHRAAFADQTPQVLGIDVGPMAAFVATQVSAELPVRITAPEHLVVPVVTDASDRAMVERVEETTRVGQIAGIVALGAAAACIGLARRTPVAIAWLGAGTVAVASVLWLSSGPVTQQILDHTQAPSEFARTLQKLLVDRAADSLAAWLLILAIGGGIVAVAGVVGQAATGRRP